MVRVITAIGDSIVDTVGRCGVVDNTQWLYKLMQALGETNIHMEPLPEFGVTPNILQNRWAAYPVLCDGSTSNYVKISYDTFILNLASYYPAGTMMFAVRVFTQTDEFTLRVFTSTDGVTWSGVPDGIISRPGGHGAGWSFCNWTPKSAKYVKLEILGNMNASEVQVISNIGNDRGTCLNKIVGENYIFNNVGLGSQQTQACLDRFARDVVDIGSDTVFILAGINDIYQNTLPSLTQNNLLAMYDMADEAKIKVVPITLLPYTPSSLTETRYLEIKSKIEALNSWIRNTAQVRRYGLCDWYNAMQDPANPGHMFAAYTCDGIHLSLLGNTKIVEAFDLQQLSVVTHDFYAVPLFKIPFSVDRVGVSPTVNFTFGNNIETSYKIYRSATSGVSLSNGEMVGTYNVPSGSASINYIPSGYYRCFGVNTHVWSNEYWVEGAPVKPPAPALGLSPKYAVASIPKTGIVTKIQIEERNLDLV